MYKLKPAFKDYVWGGTKLKTKYNKQSDYDIIAEAWELSCHKDGESEVLGFNCTLSELLKNNPDFAGKNCDKFDDFPVLIKLIDAENDLSIQVHPSDTYSKKYENQLGKTEMWYVVDCEPNAYLYYGFSEDTDKKTFEEAIKNNTVCDLLNKVDVKKGDVFFIEAGTIHAICSGILIAEVQQNSNVTYRVYDYGRVGVDGKPRELHIYKACDVTNYKKQVVQGENQGHLASCEYFTVDKIVLNGEYKNTPSDSFHSLLVVNGSGKIISNAETIEFEMGDSVFIPANNGEYLVTGQAEILLTYIK